MITLECTSPDSASKACGSPCASRCRSAINKGCEAFVSAASTASSASATETSFPVRPGREAKPTCAAGAVSTTTTSALLPLCTSSAVMLVPAGSVAPLATTVTLLGLMVFVERARRGKDLDEILHAARREGARERHLELARKRDRRGVDGREGAGSGVVRELQHRRAGGSLREGAVAADPARRRQGQHADVVVQHALCRERQIGVRRDVDRGRSRRSYWRR